MIAAFPAALMALAAPAAAADDAVLQMTSTGNVGGRIVATGTGGHYDRIETPSLTLALRLQASIAPDDGNRRIVGSELELTQAGRARGEQAAKTGEIRPGASLELAESFTLELASDGAAARSAIEACNARSSASAPATVDLPVVWRVTTGRFNFRWTDYDYLAPTDDIVSNPEFYADRRTTEREIEIAVALECKPLPQPRIAGDSVHKPVAKAAAKPAPTVERAGASANSAQTPVTTASADPSLPPKCDGGMVRELGEGRDAYLCLCPGNTMRVATGDNAFACERRTPAALTRSAMQAGLKHKSPGCSRGFCIRGRSLDCKGLALKYEPGHVPLTQAE